nr:phage late control D family protein [Rahnella sp. RcJ3]
MLFGDGPEQYQFGVVLPYCEPSGMSNGHAESVWGLKIHWNAVTGKIFKRDYNYREATTPLDDNAWSPYEKHPDKVDKLSAAGI